MNLYFLHNYNNYFNRIVKPLVGVRTLEDFEVGEYHTGDAVYITGVQFNFADHVETTQIVNWTESWSPDYMLLITDGGVIESTWFVMDSFYTRNGQFNVVLRRDVVNDHYEEVINAPCFVEKATINDPLNPLLYNSEGMQFNQIKTEEHQLFDETGCGWIVGYVAKPEDSETDVEIQTNVNLDFDATLNSLPFEKDAEVRTLPNNWQVNVAMGSGRTIVDHYRSYNFNSSFSEYEASWIAGGEIQWAYTKKPDDMNGFDITFTNSLKDDGYADAISHGFLTTDPWKYNGLVVFDTENEKYYQINVVSQGEEEITTHYFQRNSDAATVAFLYALNSTDPSTGGLYLGYTKYSTEKYVMRFKELPKGNITTKIAAGRLPLLDAPYDMFCMPYGNAKFSVNGTFINAITNAEAAINIAHAITDKLGTKLYDIQLLPYCPCREYMLNNGAFDLSSLQEGIHYSLANSGEKTESVILWCSKSSNSITIPYNHFVADAKIENETEMWRIVSPNYQGIFEFSAAKNGGINNFVVNYTYKPYNPYINVAPVWGNLYGSNFGDARGLICGGDFSLPQVSDAFNQYEINNKNYQNIFDRGIQNLDVNRKYQRINDYVGAVAGSAQGALYGGMLGGGWGAVAGGSVSLAAGLGDVAINEAMYKEAKDYQTDLYNYNLGNIKAMPDSLTKSSALTINNKTVPILERYSATELEKKMLKNKLQFNGMTVMAIGQLKDYLLPEQSYVQGQLIRIENAEDNHIATALYNEVLKGIFTIYQSEDDN